MIIYSNTSENVLCFCNLNLVSTFSTSLFAGFQSMVWPVISGYLKETKEENSPRRRGLKKIVTVHAHSDYFLDFFFNYTFSVADLFNKQMHLLGL